MAALRLLFKCGFVSQLSLRRRFFSGPSKLIRSAEWNGSGRFFSALLWLWNSNSVPSGVLNLRLTPKSASKRRYMRTNCPSRRSARPEVRALTHVCVWIGSCDDSGIYTRYSWTISNITTFSAFRHVLYLKKLKHIYALV